MNQFYKKTLFVADVYKQNEGEKVINNEECKIHFEYKYLGKGIFVKTKNGYKHIVLNKYMPHPSARTLNKYVINESSVTRLESYLKSFPNLNTKHKNWFNIEEVSNIENEFNKVITKQENDFTK